jgi:hypothetical protein
MQKSPKRTYKYEQVCLCFPPCWIRWFERQAEADGRTLSSFVRRYLIEHAPDFIKSIEQENAEVGS